MSDRDPSTIDVNSPAFWNNRKFRYVLLTCLVVYIFSAKGYIQITDTVCSVETAQAIVSRGQLDVPCADRYTLRSPDGRCYSKYGIGLPAYYVPFVAAGSALSGLIGQRTPLLYSGFHASVPPLTGFLISFANIPFVILTLVAFGKLLRLFNISEECTSFLLLGLGLGTLTWRYGVHDFSESMQMGLLMLAVYGVVRGTTRALVVGGLAFGWLLLVKPVYAAFFPVCAVYLLTRPGNLRQRIRNASTFSIPFALACGLDACLNIVRFGRVLESGYGSESSQFYPAQMWFTLPRLLGSFDKGLFIYCPLLLLSVFGWRKFTRSHHAEAVLCAMLVIENLIIAAAWHSWEGGQCWGPRLLVPLIPLWFLPVAFLFHGWRFRQRIWILVLATTVSMLAQLPGILVSDLQIASIKPEVAAPGKETFASSAYAAALILLRHKLSFGNEVYRSSEFHVGGNRTVDLSAHRTMQGLDLWTEHTARQYRVPALRYTPLVGLAIVAYFVLQIGRTLRRKTSTEHCAS